MLGLIKKSLLLGVLSVCTLCTQADDFCFLQATTYYEQIYCEVKAKGKGRSLPAFFDFQRNEPLMQALLLKRPAAKADIDMAMPVDEKNDIRPTATSPRSTSTSSALDRCALSANVIRCGSGRYQLVGNLANSKLTEVALSKSNKMGLAGFSGNLSNESQVTDYLISQYQRYLEKMMEIGLGAVTLSLEKFHFLFYDLSQRGVSFSSRFETMYQFLKKDKKNISVSENFNADPGLSIDACYEIGLEIISCSGSKRNYAYVLDK